VAEPTFKPGDVVRIRSGGPPMTVASVTADAFCSWYCGGYRHAAFPFVVPVPDDRGGPPTADGAAVREAAIRSIERHR
jgi:uncharacterized protein YodC (DUF2158 family)